MRSKKAFIALAVVLLTLWAVHADAVPSALARAIADRNSPDSPWPMFRHDARHTGRSPYIGPAWPRLRWRYPTSSCGGIKQTMSPIALGDLAGRSGGTLGGVRTGVGCLATASLSVCSLMAYRKGRIGRLTCIGVLSHFRRLNQACE